MGAYWGYMLSLDCKGCEIPLITNRTNIIHFVKYLVERIEMKAFGEPIVEHFATHDINKAGFSLVQLIETSSITGHFVDKNGDAYIDIFSCKPFNNDTVIDVIKHYFNPEQVRITYITRQA
jgi:S-adenosylmethionine/arginine decarboxylase-like enzyme